jgi:hypothetical protein
MAHALQVEELATTRALKVEELATARALHAGTAQPLLGTTLGTMHIHPICLARVRGWTENRVLWCNAHYIWVGARKAKLAML